VIERFILGVDQLSRSVGHAFAWCIVILTLGTCYEVFVRYVLNAPTAWAFDMSYLMYGAVFFMAGAYTLSRGGHVRADMFYRLWPPRVQASVELVLYLVFFFPGVTALVISGWGYGTSSMRILEVSVNSPAGVPIWPIPIEASRNGKSLRSMIATRSPGCSPSSSNPACQRATRFSTSPQV